MHRWLLARVGLPGVLLLCQPADAPPTHGAHPCNSAYDVLSPTTPARRAGAAGTTEHSHAAPVGAAPDPGTCLGGQRRPRDAAGGHPHQHARQPRPGQPPVPAPAGCQRGTLPGPGVLHPEGTGADPQGRGCGLVHSCLPWGMTWLETALLPLSCLCLVQCKRVILAAAKLSLLARGLVNTLFPPCRRMLRTCTSRATTLRRRGCM